MRIGGRLKRNRFAKFANDCRGRTLRVMRSTHRPAYKELRKRLIAAREAAGLSQGDAAARLNVPQSRLSRIESGERRPDVIELADIARLYGKRLAYFVPNADDGR